MASNIDPESSSKVKSVQALSTMLEGVRDTVCGTIDAKLIWEHMSKRQDVKRKRRIKQAVKSDDMTVFFGVVREFDLQTFVAFVDVIRKLGASDEKHYHAYRSICDRFKNWRLKPDPEDVQHLERLNAMIEECGVAGFDVHESVRGGILPNERGECSTTGALKDIRLANLKLYSPEVVTFYRSQEVNILYSYIHGIIVVAKGAALPVDSMNVVLTVNDYCRPVVIPEGYNASYSALVSLRCDPVIENFLDYMSVSIPHCAIGDLQSLCLLSGTDEDSNEKIILQEEDSIIVESVDEYYFTYRTLHFCTNKLAVHAGHVYRRHNSKPYDRVENVNLKLDNPELSMMKRVNLELKEITRRASTGSSDGTSSKAVQTVTNSGVTISAVKHALPCKTVERVGSVDSSFVIICYTPRYQTVSWKGLFIGTYNITTCYEDADALAKEILLIDDLVPTRSRPFEFLESILELYPDNDTKNGWKFFTRWSPAYIIKSYVKKCFDRINSPQLPIIEFEVQFTRKDDPMPSMFSVEFKKSRECQLRKPISLRIPCAIAEEVSSTAKDCAIKIIGDLYNDDSRICALDTALVLNYEDRECRLLLYEISFQLPDPESLANSLEISPLDMKELEVFRRNALSGNFKVQLRESAFKTLHYWVSDVPHIASNPPTLATLLKALKKDKLHVEVKRGTYCPPTYANEPSIDVRKMARLASADAVQTNWKFLARLIGMKESEISLIEQNLIGNSLHEKTTQMLNQWERRSTLSNREKKVQLFRALHCLEEHSLRGGSVSEFTNSLNDVEKW